MEASTETPTLSARLSNRFDWISTAAQVVAMLIVGGAVMIWIGGLANTMVLAAAFSLSLYRLYWGNPRTQTFPGEVALYGAAGLAAIAFVLAVAHIGVAGDQEPNLSVIVLYVAAAFVIWAHSDTRIAAQATLYLAGVAAVSYLLIENGPALKDGIGVLAGLGTLVALVVVLLLANVASNFLSGVLKAWDSWNIRVRRIFSTVLAVSVVAVLAGILVDSSGDELRQKNEASYSQNYDSTILDYGAPSSDGRVPETDLYDKIPSQVPMQLALTFFLAALAGCAIWCEFAREAQLDRQQEEAEAPAEATGHESERETKILRPDGESFFPAGGR